MVKKRNIMISVMLIVLLLYILLPNASIIIQQHKCPQDAYCLDVSRINNTIASMNVSNTTDSVYNFGVTEGT
jgi:ABC-type sulfate transport system permease component